MKKYELMKFSDFQKIRSGDKVYCRIGDKISLETVVQGAFYNYDADAPEWEIETKNGFFCWDSVYVEDIPAQPFTNDPAKMRDFRELTKEAFLQSYSYLTEAEYNATAERVKISPPKKWMLTASKDGINVDFEAVLECDTEPDFWLCYEIADNAGCTLWSIDELEE